MFHYLRGQEFSSHVLELPMVLLTRGLTDACGSPPTPAGERFLYRDDPHNEHFKKSFLASQSVSLTSPNSLSSALNLYPNKKLSQAKLNSEDRLEILCHPQDLHYPQMTLPRSLQMGDSASLLSGMAYLYLASYKSRHNVWERL